MFVTVERLIARLTAEARRASARPMTVRFVAVDLDRTLEVPPCVSPETSVPATKQPSKE
jgi:hypothetical protein